MKKQNGFCSRKGHAVIKGKVHMLPTAFEQMAERLNRRDAKRSVRITH